MPRSRSGGSSPTTHGDTPVDFDLAAPKCPSTSSRKQAVDTDAFITKPSIARANLAVSTAQPEGSPESHNQFKDYVSLSARATPSSTTTQFLGKSD